MNKSDIKKAIILGIILATVFVVGYILMDRITADIALWITGGH